ncbi:radical SAM protein [Dyadobacter pollutisoli]|uniref:Radical SAM protein n=1 Tax=Dyadobacter pollutisoli TaxID=2910158 RepID=A0A9E8NII3_9BACT|nr:radical SAM protein [Dyadobacter pollutisoli]WAC14907.1 radical SAM protein [Dyadobacter pollutisoli]
MNEKLLKGLILKISSRCNLDCTYCYMYSHGDSSFLKQPKFMDELVANQLIARLKQYFFQHAVPTFQLILHGGEPTLMSPSKFDELLTHISSEIGNTTTIHYAIQSNGTLLNDEWIAIFRKHKVSLGISIDGPEKINDLHRRDHKGNGSFLAVMDGLEICWKNNYPFALLGVQNPETDPDEIYSFIKSTKASNIDFLLPHHHHSNKPRQSGYAEWWIQLFDIWFYDRDETKPNIRFLTQIIVNCLGLGEGFDMLGQETNDYLVIETDGSIETVDAMKICGDAFTKESYHLKTHYFEQALGSPLMNLYHQSHKELAPECRKCPVAYVCGGGFLPHRYSDDRHFDNPSVYCEDLKKIIVHIQHAIMDELSEQTILEAGLEKL